MRHSKQYAAVVARFQVPTLHEGHRKLLYEAMEVSKEVVILLGVSSKVNKENPLSFEQRKEILKNWTERQTPTSTFIILPLEDIPGDDEAWSKAVDEKLDFFDIAMPIIHSRKSFAPSYKGKHPLISVSEERYAPSGTEIRESITPIHSIDFLKGTIYGVYQALKN